MRKSVSLVFTALLLIVLQSCNSSEESSVVARVGDEMITVDALEAALTSAFPKKPIDKITFEEKRQTLHDMMDTRRRYLRAVELGLEQDARFQFELRQTSDRAIALELYEKNIVQTLFDDALVHQYYDWGTNKCTVALITVGYEGVYIFDDIKRTKEEALALARQYSDSLKLAADPEAYAQRVTDDTRNRAFLKEYPLSRFGVEADKAVMNAAAGEIVGPVITERGYMVFKIMERKTVPLTTAFEDEEEILRRNMRKNMRTVERAKFDELTELYNQKYHVSFSDEGCEQFARVLEAWGKSPGFNMNTFTAEQRQIVLGSLEGFEYTSGHFINLFGSRLMREFPKFQTGESVRESVVRAQLNLAAWAAEGRAIGLDKTAKISADIKDFSVRRLAQLLEEREVDDKIEISDEEILAQYHAEQERYSSPEKIQVWQIAVADEQTGKRVLDLARNGTDFKALNDKYGQKHQGKKVQHNLRFQTRTTKHRDLVDHAFEIGPDSYGGPYQIDGSWFVIKTGEHQAMVLRPLDDVKQRINNEISQTRRKEQADQLIEKLRSAYSYKINDSLLRQLS